MNSEVDILTGKIQERKTAEQSVLNHKIEAVQLAAEKEKEMIQVRSEEHSVCLSYNLLCFNDAFSHICSHNFQKQS